MTDPIAAERAPRAPFTGLTVLALEMAVAAPLCTRHLADMGARVIKIEQPGHGDISRHYDQAVRGIGAHFVWLNHGKESVELDLTTGRDADVFRRLLAKADVLVSNLSPGALGRLGFAPQEIVGRHPRLIVVDISGYGSGGPMEHRRAYDLLVQAEAGACSITGLPGAPAKSGVPIADVATGLYALNGVLTALYDRERTGRGTLITLAMFDAVAEMMGFAANQVLHTGVEPEPVGMGSPMVAPYGAYRTQDGRTVVLGTTSDREWRRCAAMIGRVELGEDPRYRHNSDRTRRRVELDEILAAWCATRGLAEIQRRADDAGIGTAVLNDVTALTRHRQLSERDRWRTVGSPVGEVPVLLPPPTSADWIVGHGPVPGLGEHTAAVLAELADGREDPA